MNCFLLCVCCAVSEWTFSQRITCADLPEYDWVICHYSAGEPFTTSDTVMLMLDPELIDEESSDSSLSLNHMNYEWNVVFESDSTLRIYKVNQAKTALSTTTIEGNGQPVVISPNGPYTIELYGFDIKWKAQRKYIKINYQSISTTYRLQRFRNNRLLCVKIS